MNCPLCGSVSAKDDEGNEYCPVCSSPASMMRPPSDTEMLDWLEKNAAYIKLLDDRHVIGSHNFRSAIRDAMKP